LQDSANSESYRVAALKALVVVRIHRSEWRRANGLVGQCSSEECRVVVAARALSTWGEMQHPPLAKLKEESQSPD